MPEINNPQLRQFCNESLRVIADDLAHIDSILAGLLATYNDRDLGTIINSAGASNLITDGSETDGRTRCSGGDVYNMVTLLQDLQTFITTGRRDVLYKWQVNGVTA